MKSWLLVLPLLAATKGWAAPSAEVLLARAGGASTPELSKFLSGAGSLQLPANLRFARIEILFTQPVLMSRIEFQSCSGTFSDGAEVYIDFDRMRGFVEGGKDAFAFLLTANGFMRSAKSVVINLRHNVGACLKNFGIFSQLERVQIKPIETVSVSSDAPAALFDSRLETAASLKSGQAVPLQFAQETSISAIRVWNGDQHSEGSFKKGGKAKSLTISSGLPSGEKKSETLEVGIREGMQLLRLSRPMKNRDWTLEFKGEGNSEVAISELQFESEGRVLSPNVETQLQVAASQRRAFFVAAKLGDVIDDGLYNKEEDEKWALRVRSDGTIFLRGYSDEWNETGLFSFVGLYDIESSTTKGLKLKIRGYRLGSHLELDGSVCQYGCGGERLNNAKFLEDAISLSSTKERAVFVRDVVRKSAKGLHFRQQKMKSDHAEE